MDYLTSVRRTFHWLADSEGYRSSLFSFNISNEAFGELPLSKEMPLLCDTIEQGLTVLDGMLSVNFVCVKEDTIVFDLWVMKEYGIEEFWTKLFTMRDSRKRFQVLPIAPKYIFADGRVLLNSDKTDVLRTFKESDRRSNLIGPLTSDEDTMRWDGYTYTETLISPKECVLG
ncbi:hypothetical protein KY290_015139 [Solanum tuberosum]|uniref:F-box associated beta-propeller type 1 domain-containing protein n=1 Tax=Solanum tuberosum TaxID=4113 RepID=A0ABQ7VRT0_SOLTU|nr:hypothetical protein KY290_015139 [Solanum tuberosum]